MTYKKRFDKRDFDQTRPLSAEADVIKNADGSGFFKIGGTEAYAAVYGPREMHPRSKRDKERAVLRCKYNMMPFAGSGDRVRPGFSRRSEEINLVTSNALLPVIDLEKYPNAVVDVYIELPQTDAGSRCAGICAASIALADAGVEMEDMVPAVGVGKVDDKVVVDLNYEEESYEDGDVADVPVAMIPSTGEITLLQMDGKISEEEIEEALEKAESSLKKIAEVQREALRKSIPEAEGDNNE